jgi:Domain of unknown function (DUF4365)
VHPIPDVDVEAELSYALLHAVAAKAKAQCKIEPRLGDARGIDAQLTSWGPFPFGAKQEVDLKIQLKATKQQTSETDSHISYSLSKVAQYDQLREVRYTVPRILVVLFLPEASDSWISISPESLMLKRAAYWVSLVGAPSVSTASTTVYLPKSQLLTPESLQQLLTEVAFARIPEYKLPEVVT